MLCWRARCHPSAGQGQPRAGLHKGSLSARQEPVFTFVLSQLPLLRWEFSGCNTGTGPSPGKLGACWCRWGAGLCPQPCPLPAGSLSLFILIWFCQYQLQAFTESRSTLPASEPHEGKQISVLGQWAAGFPGPLQDRAKLPLSSSLGHPARLSPKKKIKMSCMGAAGASELPCPRTQAARGDGCSLLLGLLNLLMSSLCSWWYLGDCAQLLRKELQPKYRRGEHRAAGTVWAFLLRVMGMAEEALGC